MTEKELDVVNWDNICLTSAYIIELEKKSYGVRSAKLQTAFGGIIDNSIHGNHEIGESYDTAITLKQDMKALGEIFTVDVLEYLDIRTLKFREVEKKYPAIAKKLKAKVPKIYFQEINTRTVTKRKKYKEEVQKQYDELTQLFKEYGSRADKTMMQDINDLSYCEAQGFMLKLEERINKKANPKNLRLYKALQAIRGKDVITCK